MANTNSHLTETEFLNRFIRREGFDELERLLDSGFEPKLTTAGWRWIYTKTNVENKSRMAFAA